MPNNLIKVVLIGPASANKAALIKSYAPSPSLPVKTTVGIDFQSKTITHDGNEITLQIWDTAGQERFNAISNNYLAGAGSILLMYNTTNPDGLKEIEGYLKNIRNSNQVTEATQIFLVGANALDSTRQVSLTEANNFGLKNGIHSLIEVNANTSLNVDKLFGQVVDYHVARQAKTTVNGGPQQTSANEAPSALSNILNWGMSWLAGSSSTTSSTNSKQESPTPK